MKVIIQRIISYSQKQYITVLIALSIVAGINYMIVIDKLKEQEGSVIVLKMSTDQSNIVHAINLLTIKIPFANKKQYRAIKSQLIQQKTLLRDTHQILKSGVRFLRKEGRLITVISVLPDELKSLYFDKPVDLDNRINQYLSIISQILKKKHGDLSRESSEIQLVINTIDSLSCSIVL